MLRVFYAPYSQKVVCVQLLPPPPLLFEGRGWLHTGFQYEKAICLVIMIYHYTKLVNLTI